MMTDNADDLAAQALALHQQGQFAEAEPLYLRALEADGRNAGTLSLLGTLYLQTKRNEEAADLLGQAIALQDDQPGWHANLGLVLRNLERYDEAETALRRALALRPAAETYSNLGLVQHQLGQFEAAIASFEEAIKLRPDLAGPHVNVGTTYLKLEMYDEAAASFRAAIALSPRHVVAMSNLGLVLFRAGKLEAAETELRAAIEINPRFAEALRVLGEVVRDQGRMAEAIELFRRGVEIDPSNVLGYQGLIFGENYISAGTPAEALDAARHFDEIVSRPAPVPFPNSRDPERRLKIGFVSGDFRRHPVGQFFGHMLPHFDRQQVEVTLYANQTKSDGTTLEMRETTDHWRPIARLSDEAAAEQIRADGTDILIDLSGHTGGNRLQMFALRPAPVQAAWLGYSGTTGLSTIDHIIADDDIIPVEDEAHYSETPVRLPASYLCYSPPKFHGVVPEVAPTPADANGFVTFGTYNNLFKVSDASVACWAKVLAAVPDSRLLLKGAALASEDGRSAVERRFSEHGIAPDRLLLKASVGSHLVHFRSYSEIDIGLDPFPYNGTTTSCDSLWMGVPFVALAGDRFISRVGVSLLRSVGLGDLVAGDVDQYVQIARDLAADLPRLRRIRAGLRDDLMASPLGDVERFTRHFEAGLREMWRRWCATAA